MPDELVADCADARTGAANDNVAASAARTQNRSVAMAHLPGIARRIRHASGVDARLTVMFAVRTYVLISARMMDPGGGAVNCDYVRAANICSNVGSQLEPSAGRAVSDSRGGSCGRPHADVKTTRSRRCLRRRP